MFKLKDEEVLYILEVQLPEMLDRDPSLEPRAYRAFLRAFISREEAAAIFGELQALHNEIYHFRQEVGQRFEQVDQRFGQVDQRFEQVDQRFEQVDQRFEQVDQRFDQVDQRLDQVDQRLDQVDQRLDQVDRRFDQVDQRLEQVVQDVAEVRQEIVDLRHYAEYISGRVQTRIGRSLEDVVAGALRSALRRPDIKPDQLRLRQKIVDTQGLVGLPGRRRFEIDILAQDGQLTVFEVKSYCEWEDIDHLADAVTLVRAMNPERRVEGVMIALAIGDEVQTRCAELGITLVYRGEEFVE